MIIIVIIGLNFIYFRLEIENEEKNNTTRIPIIEIPYCICTTDEFNQYVYVSKKLPLEIVTSSTWECNG